MTAQADRPAAVRVGRALTDAEEQLWLLDRDRPGDPAYVVPFALWVDGPLDVPLLALALHTVVRSAGGTPMPEVLEPSDVPCPVTVVESDTEALAAARAAAATAFADGELRLRAQVFRIRADRWLLMLVLHEERAVECAHPAGP